MLPMMETPEGLSRSPGGGLLNLSLHVLPSKNVSAPEGYSSAIWLVLFFTIICLSMIVNTLYIAVTLCKRNLAVIHVILGFFFLVNLVDYALLVFEFYFNPAANFPYSEGSCTLYQLTLQGTNLLRSATVVFMIYQTYISTCVKPQSTHHSKYTIILVVVILVGLVLLSLPSFFYSKIVANGGSNSSQYCVIDLSSLSVLTGSDAGRRHAFTALFFLIYKSVLVFWVPLFLVGLPVSKMAKHVNTVADRNFVITITITVVISFFVFYFPLAVSVTAR